MEPSRVLVFSLLPSGTMYLTTEIERLAEKAIPGLSILLRGY